MLSDTMWKQTGKLENIFGSFSTEVIATLCNELVAFEIVALTMGTSVAAHYQPLSSEWLWCIKMVLKWQ